MGTWLPWAAVAAAVVGLSDASWAMWHTPVALEAFLHVGDDPERDVEAARRVGMSTVWVNRDDNSWPPHLRPADLEVHDLAGLVENLDQSPSV